jgi:hypothetical protein
MPGSSWYSDAAGGESRQLGWWYGAVGWASGATPMSTPLSTWTRVVMADVRLSAGNRHMPCVHARCRLWCVMNPTVINDLRRWMYWPVSAGKFQRKFYFDGQIIKTDGPRAINVNQLSLKAQKPASNRCWCFSRRATTCCPALYVYLKLCSRALQELYRCNTWR